MIFQREHCKAIQRPTTKKVALELARTKSSFASLTSENGSYIQVAGGPGLFVLEYRTADGKHFRAYQTTPIAISPDGTTLESSAGRIPMDRADWFLLLQVTETFSAFLNAAAWPAFLQWRELEISFTKYSS
jgi:hypothetical protein